MPTQRERAIALINNCGAFNDRQSLEEFILQLVAFTDDSPATNIDWSAIPERDDDEHAAATGIPIGGVYFVSENSNLPESWGTLRKRVR